MQSTSPASTGVVYLDQFHAMQTAEAAWTTYEATLSPVVPNRSLLLPSGVGANVGWLKLRSGTRALPVAQEADRAFTLVLAGVT